MTKTNLTTPAVKLTSTHKYHEPRLDRTCNPLLERPLLYTIVQIFNHELASSSLLRTPDFDVACMLCATIICEVPCILCGLPVLGCFGLWLAQVECSWGGGFWLGDDHTRGREGLRATNVCRVRKDVMFCSRMESGLGSVRLCRIAHKMWHFIHLVLAPSHKSIFSPRGGKRCGRYQSTCRLGWGVSSVVGHPTPPYLTRPHRLNQEPTSTLISALIECSHSLFVVGNKDDDPERKVVLTHDAQRFAEQMGIQLYETSAKENINVEEVRTHMRPHTYVHAHTQTHIYSYTHREDINVEEVRTHNHPHTHTHTRMENINVEEVRTHMRPHTDTHIHTCAHTDTHTHTHACIYILTNKHAHIQVNTHTHMHAHTRKHAQTLTLCPQTHMHT